jgi:hypothetical protein
VSGLLTQINRSAAHLPHDGSGSLGLKSVTNGDEMPVRNARTIGIELLRACVVLALVFLSFAHAPISASAGAGDVLTAAIDMTWCGDAPATDGTAHAPCHACRLGAGADLPPACAVPLPLRAVAEVRYGALPVLSLPALPTGLFYARGPPVA